MYFKVLTIKAGIIWTILGPKYNKALVNWSKEAGSGGECLVYKGNIEQT